MANLTKQMVHAVCECECYGQSRHRDKQGSDDVSYKVYSIGEKEQLEKRCEDFGRFMKAEFPDVRRVVDIRQEHVQAWLDSKAETCAQSTIGGYLSNMKKLDVIFGRVYNAHGMHADAVKPPKSEKADLSAKDQVMDKEKISLLIDELKATGSQAWKAVALADASGLRVNETANIHVECFSLTGGKYNCGQVHVRAGSIDGSKHGRERTVDVLTPQARDMIKECLQDTQTGQTVIQKTDGSSMKAESIDRAVSRAMDRVNVRQGHEVFGSEWKENKLHAVRKSFAQDCWNVSRNETDGLSDKQSRKEACAFVNRQLGHGDTRMDSISTYVHDAW